MKKNIVFAVVVCLILVFGAAAAEGMADSTELEKNQSDLHYELPENWISIEIGKQAAELGMVHNATNPEGTIMLQVFLHENALLTDVVDTIALLSNAENIIDKQTETIPYVAYTIDSMRCYAVQVNEEKQLMLNFSVLDGSEMERVDEIAQRIITSITTAE
ncbi:MAG: hypothetical protein VB099_15430 [Candidatus Limiplasma sp.]|nr:hypothetical protein [Candidatus Limiplasma sp.]